MFNTRKNRLIDELQHRIQDEHMANEDLQKQIRTIEHGIGLDRLRHELEVEEARQQGRRQGDELVRSSEQRHAHDVVTKLESLNKEILQRLPTVNVDKHISRKDSD